MCNQLALLPLSFPIYILLLLLFREETKTLFLLFLFPQRELNVYYVIFNQKRVVLSLKNLSFNKIPLPVSNFIFKVLEIPGVET